MSARAHRHSKRQPFIRVFVLGPFESGTCPFLIRQICAFFWFRDFPRCGGSIRLTRGCLLPTDPIALSIRREARDILARWWLEANLGPLFALASAMPLKSLVDALICDLFFPPAWTVNVSQIVRNQYRVQLMPQGAWVRSRVRFHTNSAVGITPLPPFINHPNASGGLDITGSRRFPRAQDFDAGIPKAFVSH